MTEKEIQFRDKQEVRGGGEPTKGGITFVPAVDIFETRCPDPGGRSAGGQSGGHPDRSKGRSAHRGRRGYDPSDPQERVLLKEYRPAITFGSSLWGR